MAFIGLGGGERTRIAYYRAVGRVCMRGSASGKSGYGRWRARTEKPVTLERENNYGRSKEGDLRGVRDPYVPLSSPMLYTGMDKCGKSDA